jgi:hypothetical protein
MYAESRLEAGTLVVRIPMRLRAAVQPQAHPGAGRQRADPADQARTGRVLVKAPARAWRWQKLLDTGVHGSVTEIAEAEEISKSYVSRILRLALLAPDMVEAILGGWADQRVMLERRERPLPVGWEEQSVPARGSSWMARTGASAGEWPSPAVARERLDAARFPDYCPSGRDGGGSSAGSGSGCGVPSAAAARRASSSCRSTLGTSSDPSIASSTCRLVASILTSATPSRVVPSLFAAPCDRSMSRPSTYGPRSLTSTSTCLPVEGSVTVTSAPSGSSGWAAVIASWSNGSPLAVGRPWNPSP